MTRTRLVLLAIALCCTSVRGAAAQRAPGLEQKRREAAAAVPPRRPVPDYDGRGEEPTDAGDVLVWAPRIVLAPLYVVSEYIVRRPIGWLLSKAEREQWAAAVFSLFQFGPNREIAIVPTALFDFGFRPSIGVYSRWKDFLVPHNRIVLHAATGGEDWLQVALADRIESGDERRQVQLGGAFTHRPDALFYGIGLDSSRDNASRYAFTLKGVELSFAQRFWRSSSARAFARVRRADFGGETYGDEPSIERRVADGSLLSAEGTPLPLPPGYVEGYTIYGHGIQLLFDSRKPRPEEGSGVRLGLYGEYALGLHSDAAPRDPARRYLRYGIAPEIYWDLTGQNRVLHLGLNLQLMDSIYGDVPFTELIDLSDTGPMKGFKPGRLIGPSAAALTLEYEWPIWVWLDGTLHVAAGNAFGPEFEGFALDELRISTGLGIRAPSERDHAFNFILAVGTKTLREGAALDSFRLLFGGTRVF